LHEPVFDLLGADGEYPSPIISISNSVLRTYSNTIHLESNGTKSATLMMSNVSVTSANSAISVSSFQSVVLNDIQVVTSSPVTITATYEVTFTDVSIDSSGGSLELY
jgi:hypothetical protein